MKRIILLALVFRFSPLVFSQTNELPSGVPNPIGADGKFTPSLTFTTKAYQDAAFRTVLREANIVAQQLRLSEQLPITETNVVQSYVSPFGIAWLKKRIGSIATTNYAYYVSQGNKFSYLVAARLEENLKRYGHQYAYPTSQEDTNAAYQLATQFLANAGMDVTGLNRDYVLVVKPDDIFYGRPNKTFVPVYDIYWISKNSAVGSVASVQLLLPEKKLLQLHVENPNYILRQPLVFENLASLLAGPNTTTTAAPETLVNSKSDEQGKYSVPQKLASQIKDANRLEVTYRFAEQFKQFQGFKFSVPAQRVSEIVRAVSRSKQYENSIPSDSMWEWELHFYDGTNRLGAIDFQSGNFLADGEYRDDTGVLDKLQQDVLKEANVESGK